MSDRAIHPDRNVASLLRLFVIIISLCLCVTAAQAQETKQPTKQPNEDDVDVLRVRSNLVNVEVTVKDKKGKYVTDLKAEDFIVFENGVQQKVTFFEPPLVGDTSSSPSADQPVTPMPGAIPRNIITLVLDGQTTDLANLKFVREGTIKYIREKIADTDTVALFAITSDLRLLQPFTQDKAKLIQAVEKAYSVSGSSKGYEQRDISESIAKEAAVVQSAPGVGPDSITTQAAGSAALRAMIAARVMQQFIKLRSALSAQQTRPILASLAAICEAQRGIPGKKTLVLFSQGFVTPESLDWQAQSTIDIANRANVAIYIIDSAGLKAPPPQGGGPVPTSPLNSISAATNQEQRIRAVGGETIFDYARQEGPGRGDDILYRISGDTGGQFIKNTNDIAKGLNRIDQEIRSRYTLAYQSTDPNFDGGYRKLKVDVSRPDTQVISRSGYYALAHDEIISLSPDDKRLLATVAAAENDPGLPLFLDLVAFRSQDGRYVVPLSIEVPPSAVRFDQKGKKQLMQLDVIGVIREGQNKILSRLGGNFNVALTAEQYDAIQSQNIFYRQEVELAPGTYDVDLIVRDKLSGKTAGRRKKLVLPVPASDFSTSGIVLSRHVELVPKTLGSPETGDVLHHGGVEIRPSASRAFQPKDNLIIFFEIYNAAFNSATSKPHVRVSLTLMKGGKAVTKPISYELTEALDQRTPHLTFSKYISLDRLQAGSYTAKIGVLDMATGELIDQQAAFVITR